MGRITTFLVAVALLTLPASASAAVSREVNGAPVSDWHGLAAIITRDGGFCSGFVAGWRLVITAAHCGPASRVYTAPLHSQRVRRTVPAPGGADLEVIWLRSRARWKALMRFSYPAVGSRVNSFGLGLTDPTDPNSLGTSNVTAQTVIGCPWYLIGQDRFCADGGLATLAEGDSGGPVTGTNGYPIGINEGFSAINGDPRTTMAPDVFVSLAPLRSWINRQLQASR